MEYSPQVWEFLVLKNIFPGRLLCIKGGWKNASHISGNLRRIEKLAERSIV